jgi:hypothetical protein
MRQVRPDTVRAELAFAEKAAAWFSEHPEHRSYTDGYIEPGCLLALRWGLGNDCVLVMKLDEFFEPTIYTQIIGMTRLHTATKS